MLITKGNITSGAITQLSALGICMKLIRPWYFHGHSDLGALKGCVGTLPQGYVHNVPLPKVPLQQSTMSHQIPDYYKDQYRVPTYVTPCSLVESAAYVFSPSWQALATNILNNLLSNP